MFAEIYWFSSISESKSDSEDVKQAPSDLNMLKTELTEAKQITDSLAVERADSKVINSNTMMILNEVRLVGARDVDATRKWPIWMCEDNKSCGWSGPSGPVSQQHENVN